MKRNSRIARMEAIILAAGMIVADLNPVSVSAFTNIRQETVSEADVITKAEGTPVTEEESCEQTAEPSEIISKVITPEEQIEMEQEFLGSEEGISKVIGFEGKTAVDGTMASDNGEVTEDYINLNVTRDNDIEITGQKVGFLEKTTGLYLYNGTYYENAVDINARMCRLYGKIAEVMYTEPVRDNATGLYVADGKYYSSYSTTATSVPKYYFFESNEVVAAGVFPADMDIYALYGRKLDSDDASYRYYEIDGNYYSLIRSLSFTKEDGTEVKSVYAQKTWEISFDERYHIISWNAVTNATEVVLNGKLLQIGYQIRLNGELQDTDLKTIADEPFLIDTHYQSEEPFSEGEEVDYEVRAVYYTETDNQVINPDGSGSLLTSYEIVKIGEWSNIFTYKFEKEKEKQRVPQVSGLTVTRKSTKIAELSWNGIAAASGYHIQYVQSDVPTGEIAETDWTDFDTTNKTYEEIDLDIFDQKYMYFRVTATIDYDSEVYEEGSENYSESVVVEKASETVVPAITEFTIDNEMDRSFTVKWELGREESDVCLFYTTDISLLETGVCTYLLRNASTSSGVKLANANFIREKYKIAKKRVVMKYLPKGTKEISSRELGLDYGKQYYFAVAAYDNSKCKIDRTNTEPYIVYGISYGYYTDIGKLSAVVGAKRSMETVEVPATKSEKQSITITFSKDLDITGYEIYRKNAKGSYKKIVTTTSAQYVDQNLEEMTEYEYKARAYYYNVVTKKLFYSPYRYFSAETSTSNYFDLKAAKSGTSAIKLSWTKVAGADRYEIYRCTAVSTDTTASKNNSSGNQADVRQNTKWKLISTIAKRNTVTFTDKKLTSGKTYGYKVVACYTEQKDTEEKDTEEKDTKQQDTETGISRQVFDTEWIEMGISTPSNLKTAFNKNKLVITWDKDVFAEKYEVQYQKYNAEGRAYTASYKKVSTTKNKFTLKNLNYGERVSVRVRAYDGERWTSFASAEDIRYLAAAKNITVKEVTEKSKEGNTSVAVSVSWKKVSGAAYYKVYRSTSPAACYDSDGKCYVLPKDCEAIAKESNDDENNSVVPYKEYKGQQDTIKALTAIDRGQLQKGVSYYYYVIAYAKNGTAVSAGSGNPGVICYQESPTIKSVTAKKGQNIIAINQVDMAKEYVIYRSTSKDKGYEVIGTTTKAAYTDKKVVSNQNYYYKVTARGTNALRADFESVMSASKKVTAK